MHVHAPCMPCLLLQGHDEVSPYLAHARAKHAHPLHVRRPVSNLCLVHKDQDKASSYMGIYILPVYAVLYATLA